jgi:hypothetical protein
MQRVKQVANLIRNMGMRYVLFRAGYEVRKKTGLLKKAHPVDPPFQKFINIEDWKIQQVKFFFDHRSELKVSIEKNQILKQQAESILDGKYLYFGSVEYDLGVLSDWNTNPDTGYKFNVNKHWSDINDFSKEAGDIKFVWEKSRFGFLYTLIRYDHHFKKDLAPFVFKEIEGFIDLNPINLGPNFKCSQEISLRILNWTFGLNYYRDNSGLTALLFEKILNSIYWQTRHVYSNINFARIAVRNNHAITETLTLYLVGLLYPFFPEAKKWRTKGKKWFEQEIEYQIYSDGTFLQFSMNYQRVVVQLLTWAIGLAKANNESFKEVVYQRAKACLDFLTACMNFKNGRLPNYGANDGALFFPLSNNDFGDYRPQLEALSILLERPCPVGQMEDKFWYGLPAIEVKAAKTDTVEKLYSFKNGGYYILKEAETLTFIRCGDHKHRPSQADNLHIDIWVNGENIMRDAGSYKYNTDEETIKFFFGTASHNTVMLGDYDQMEKGSRFIWYYWSGPASGEWKEENDYFEFTGKLHSFKHVARNIIHTRVVRKYKNKLKWEITDNIDSPVDLPMTQIWNPYEKFDILFSISAFDKSERLLQTSFKDGWYSGKYGKKEPTTQILYTSARRYIRTIIESKALEE